MSYHFNLTRGGGTLCILSERIIKKKHHVSYNTILGMENAFMSQGVEIKNISKVSYIINSILKRTGVSSQVVLPFDVPKCQMILFVAMSKNNLKAHRELLRKIASNHKLILYCFDTWEADYNEWKILFSYINPSHIFLAYQASVEYFSKKFSNVFFIPQSMDEKFFYPRDGIIKSRLFMQMGRKNQKIHEMILDYLARLGLPDINENYVYERIPRTIIFPDTNELAENICGTKYFVCAPQSDENSKLTGKCSDVTARFRCV